MPYIGNSPKNNVRGRFYYTASASQTLFSGADIHGRTLKYQDGGYVDVYLNGVLLQDTIDYTATTKTSVTLVSGATAGDLVEIVAYGIFSVADTVSATSGGEFNGAIDINGDLTVDTNTLYVDSTNNRVGIRTASPLAQSALTIAAGAGAGSLSVTGADGNFSAGGQRSFIDFAGGKARVGGTGGGSTGTTLGLYVGTGLEAVSVTAAGEVTMTKQPFFSAYKNGNQALSAHTPTKITTWTTLYDVGSGWDATNNRWTAPIAGYYLIHVCAQANVLGGLHVRLDVNGSNGWNGDSYLDGGDVTGMDNAYFASLAANDYVEFYCYLTSAGNINANRTRFSVVKCA